MIIKDARIWLDGTDFSGVTNQVAISRSAADLTSTTMDSDGNVEREAGLLTSTLDVTGRLDREMVADNAAFESVGRDGGVFVVAAQRAAGARAWAHEGVLLSYSPNGKVGDLLTFTASIAASGALVEGKLAVASGTVVAAGTGDGVQLGAVATGGRLVAAVEVFALAVGEGLELVIESDSTDAFSTPTTVATITLTAAGAHWAEVVGPITDTWFRVSWTPTDAATFGVFLGSV